MRWLVSMFLWIASTAAMASVPLEASLTDLAGQADHILVARVVGVDMIDGRGQIVRDKARRTGPGQDERIRLHLEVQEVLITNADRVPRLLKVPLDPFMHYSLGQIEEAHREPSEPRLVLLRGAQFESIVPGRFSWALEDKAEALRIHAEAHP